MPGRMIPKTIIHLLSGGLDSVSLLYDLKRQGHQLHCALVDYGQPHLKELKYAKAHCGVLAVLFTEIKIPELGGLVGEDWIIPNRNAILLSLAINLASRAKADTVTIGCNADDSEVFPDCRPAFITAMNQAVKAAGYNIEVCAPYITKSKQSIGQLARKFRINAEHIWTCYRGGETPCGKCLACLKLQEALA